MSDNTGWAGPGWAASPPPPPTSPPPATPPPSARPTPWPWFVLGGVVVAAVLVAGLALVVNADDDVANGGGPGRTVVHLEAIDHVSTEPFTESVVNAGIVSGPPVGSAAVTTSPPTDTTDTTDGSLHVASTTGGRAGLYGSSTAGEACDRPALVRHLDGNQDVRATWAGLAGVAPEEAAATINELTPLVLRHDTAVTNHTYRSGTGHAYQAVLQGGTPVLVDDEGVPRVQCSCGNPLLPPDLPADAPVDLDGDAWDDFTPGDVITVDPEPVDEFETIDVDTGEEDTVAVGSTPDFGADHVELDGHLVDDDAGVRVVSADGEVTTVLDHPVAVAFDDGAGGLIYQHRRDEAPRRGWGLSSLVYQSPTTEDEAAIWHLPAGEAESVELLGSDAPGDRWYVASTAATWQGRRVLAYVEVTHDPSGYEDEATQGTIKLLDLESLAEQTVVGPVSVYEGVFGPVTISGDRLAVDRSYDLAAWDLYDGDLAELRSGCAYPRDGETACQQTSVLRSAGQYAALHVDETGSPFAVLLIDVDTGAITEDLDLRGVHVGTTTAPGGIDAWDDEVVVWWRVDSGTSPPAISHDLATGDTSLLDAARGRTWILRAPLVRPATPPEAEPVAEPEPEPEPEAPEDAGEPTADPIDLESTVLPPNVCQAEGIGEHGPVVVRDGYGIIGDEAMGEHLQVDPASARYADLDGDGNPEILVLLTCEWPGGGSAYTRPIVALRPDGPDSLELAGPPLHAGPSRRIGTFSASGPTIEVDGLQWLPDDLPCCPTGTFSDRWDFRDGRWTQGD